MIQLFKSEDYQKFLLSNREFIIKVFSIGNHKNLRTLKFVLDIFYDVFNILHKENSIKKEYKNDILTRFLFSICIYSIEYKKNQNIDQLSLLKTLSHDSDAFLVKQLGKQVWGLGNKEKSLENKLTPSEEYIERIESSYLEDTSIPYIFFEWISPLVHSGLFEEMDIKNDAQKMNDDFEIKKINPEYIKLGRIENWLLLENDEIKEAVQDVLTEVDNGRYPIAKYMYIFELFENIAKSVPDSIDINVELVNRFKNAIDQSISNSTYIDNFPNLFIGRTNQTSNFFQAVEKYVIDSNNSLLQEKQKKIAIAFDSALRSHSIEAVQGILFDKEVLKISFFHFVDVELFYSMFIALSNKQKKEFYETMGKMSLKYNQYNASFEKEIVFYNDLQNFLETSNSVEISKIYCDWLVNLCRTIIEQINRFSGGR